jgi:predicted nucleotidyltransferase
MEKHVPAAAFVKAKEAIQGLITVKAMLERLIDAKSASKEDRTQMKSVAQLISNAKVYIKKFEGYRADAASESD